MGGPDPHTEDIATVAAEASEVVEELVWQVLTAQHPATP